MMLLNTELLPVSPCVFSLSFIFLARLTSATGLYEGCNVLIFNPSNTFSPLSNSSGYTITLAK